MHRLEAATARRNPLAQVLELRRLGIVVLQAVSILIFQLASVLAIRRFSSSPGRDGTLPRAMETSRNNGNGVGFGPLALRLVSSLQARIAAEQAKGKTQAEIARTYRLAPKYISYVLNYESYGPGSPPLSINPLQQLAAIIT